MSLKLTEQELQRYRDDERIVRETARQVIKDFALFGMHVDFPDDINWAYNQLFEQLNVHVDRLLSEHNRLLLALLYQIDVSEKKINDETSTRTDIELSEIVTELILDRELKKVITRHYYSRMGNQGSSGKMSLE